jgi:hypothetical protein
MPVVRDDEAVVGHAVCRQVAGELRVGAFVLDAVGRIRLDVGEVDEGVVVLRVGGSGIAEVAGRAVAGKILRVVLPVEACVLQLGRQVRGRGDRVRVRQIRAVRQPPRRARLELDVIGQTGVQPGVVVVRRGVVREQRAVDVGETRTPLDRGPIRVLHHDHEDVLGSWSSRRARSKGSVRQRRDECDHQDADRSEDRTRPGPPKGSNRLETVPRHVSTDASDHGPS